MTEIPFSPEAIPRLLSLLEDVGREVGPVRRRVVDRLSIAVIDYEEREQLTCPELLESLPRIVDELRGVRESAAKEICDHVSTYCRGCMFHNDACFMNVIFLAFKSLEVGRLVDPNRVRPSMRILVR